MFNDNDIKLKELHSVWGPAEAEVVKSFLESHRIKCILKGLVVQSVHPFSADGLGEVKIYVNERDYKKAKNLIDSFKNEE
jgi:hypothetical protein